MADEETKEPAAFTIGGADYPIPVVATFDMDEAEILWGYCQVGLEDLVPDDDGTWSDQRNEELLLVLKKPSFRRTLLHVAYRRGNPDATRQQIEKEIGKVSNLGALAAWAAQFADAGPPAEESTSKPKPPSTESLVDSSKSSGNGSSTTSPTEPESLPAPTGATG